MEDVNTIPRTFFSPSKLGFGLQGSLKKGEVFLIVTFSLSNFIASVGACNLISHVVDN